MDENNNSHKISVELLFECEKFQDSVTNLKFSCDGKLKNYLLFFLILIILI